MRKEKIEDERLNALRKKINSEAFGILMFVLLGSVLIQQFIMKAAFDQYAGEFIAFFGISIYIVFRHLTLGMKLFGEGKRAKMIPLINSLILAGVVTLTNGIVNYTTYADKYRTDGIGYFLAVLMVTFISAWLSAYLILLFMTYLSKKKQEKIEKRLDMMEEEE